MQKITSFDNYLYNISIDYYQVAWEISSENTLEREFTALEKLQDNYPKFILTTDSFTQNRSGIKHVNVFNWLLEN